MDTLANLLKNTISWYAAGGNNVRTFLLYNDQEQTYAVNVIDTPQRKLTAGVVVLARLEGDYIIIEEDTTDKPLYKKLLEQGVPREQIILAYAGETLPQMVYEGLLSSQLPSAK